MTTICSDGVTVAADGLVTVGDEPVTHDQQKIFYRGVIGFEEAVIGYAGARPYQDAAIRWVLQGSKPDLMPVTAPGDQHRWTVIVFRKSGVTTYRCENPYPDYYGYPFAIGAGEDYALGALLAGASPVRAVAIAAKCNVFTGGEILSLEVGPRSSETQEAAE